MSSESSNYQDDIIDIGGSRDWRGIEFEVNLIDDAMMVVVITLMMDMMSECSEAVRSSRAELI
jgi:hypothetical protein